MELFTELADISLHQNIAIALGTFDGIHAGHQQIIGQAVQLARQSSGTSVVFTFRNHPLSIIDPERCPPFIMAEEEKVEVIAGMGVDILMSIPFDVKFLQLMPDEFIQLLIHYFRPAHVVVGPNYTFGYQGKGNPEILRKAGASYHFDVQVPEAVLVDHSLVSSTLIRQLIASGDVQQAAKLLGRPFVMAGIVMSGDQRGRQLGYPTANIPVPPGMVIPADGVYAVQVMTGNTWFNGLANVGVNPTFNGQSRRIEVFILNFNDDLYNKKVRVSFLARLRGEVKFAGAEALKEQIARDITEAQVFF
ncbi:bifunctional riboflavin kinase/FAD synthetase [Anaerospora hongkongensis]|uniref:bifunctional riboflavin kinase/FAD synthetase n=1 Tax=Anaerospora hongkongensis TaxID=244830 RepID=UPI00289F2EEA|nr:bifunctional riboflavin kinase/FAD synthetase [Anaerospora hongkongensis]